MGQWTVTEVSGLFRPMAVGNNLGHTFMVTLRFRHNAAPYGPYVEMPRLVWREKIVHKDYNTMKSWLWGEVESKNPQDMSGDLYGYHPSAGTFSVWRKRYLLAYQNANNEQPPTHFGECQLTIGGIPVAIQLIQAAVAPPAVAPPTAAPRFQLPGFMTRSDRTSQPRQVLNSAPISDEDKAKAVRSFIQQNNCELTIKIIDRPMVGNVQVSGNGHSKHMERLLLFNCGVVGQTIRAHQLLRTHSPQGTPSPSIHFALNWPTSMTLPLDGFSPDLDKAISNFQYERMLLGTGEINHALSFQPDGHLGSGEYR